MVRISCLFSFLSGPINGLRVLNKISVFNITQERNLEKWLTTRLQNRGYTLKATGWERVVSGLQSLVSMYLLALFVLTYLLTFGGRLNGLNRKGFIIKSNLQRLAGNL